MKNATLSVRTDIDITVDGIVLFFEGIDTDLAQLFMSASTFETLHYERRNIGTSDLTMRSVKSITFSDRGPIDIPDEGELTDDEFSAKLGIPVYTTGTLYAPSCSVIYEGNIYTAKEKTTSVPGMNTKWLLISAAKTVVARESAI